LKEQGTRFYISIQNIKSVADVMSVFAAIEKLMPKQIQVN
jgi:hypothetical protein